ncbi:MAG: TrkH family potassium uptake protein [Myxococcota bacterium]|jgi:trk system potassium uptake protein TrkH|nr:TrkH family potassium uptake protein [Myxococcota bacterium]
MAEVKQLGYIPLSARRVSKVLGMLLMALAATMLSGVAVAVFYDEARATIAFTAAASITFVSGLLLRFAGWKAFGQLSRRDALLIVGLGWLLTGALGALPYLFDGTFTSFVDAFFETLSGFTTTGASVLTDIEGSCSKAILFWRSLTQWLGGMGIIVLFVAVFPQMGARYLFQNEVPGPIAEDLKPKIKETSKVLWILYAGLTLINALLLWGPGGMTLFDAICHAFTTLSTGGFSTKNASIGHFYANPAVDIITTVFMMLAGVNFSLYYLAVFQRNLRRALRDRELWLYTACFVLVSLAVAFSLFIAASPQDEHTYAQPLTALRDAAFTTASLVTSTGFGNSNSVLWPPFTTLLLVFVMLVGGSAGSTAGGIKVFRLLVLAKASYNELFRTFRPQFVRTLRIGSNPVRAEIVHGIAVFFAIYVLLLIAGALFVAAYGHDLITSSTAALACLSNMGPGFGEVGPYGNFAAFEPPVKVMLTLLMVLGRLELFTLLVLLVPAFWRR